MSLFFGVSDTGFYYDLLARYLFPVDAFMLDISQYLDKNTKDIYIYTILYKLRPTCIRSAFSFFFLSPRDKGGALWKPVLMAKLPVEIHELTRGHPLFALLRAV